MVDGRQVNGRYWLSVGGMTSLPHTLTLTDTVTGRVRSWTHSEGRLASFVDVETFSQ